MSRPKAVTFKGNAMTLAGKEMQVGQSAPAFTLHFFKDGLKTLSMDDLKGKPSLISIVPSLDTGVCAIQTKKFNEQIGEMADTVNAVTVSLDLPFAMNRFCGDNNIDNIRSASDYMTRDFGKNWGVLIEELQLLARAVYVLDSEGKIIHGEIVSEVTHEPNYDAALSALKGVLASA